MEWIGLTCADDCLDDDVWDSGMDVVWHVYLGIASTSWGFITSSSQRIVSCSDIHIVHGG